MAYNKPEDLPIDISFTDPLEGDALYGDDKTDELRDRDDSEQPSDRAEHWSLKESAVEKTAGTRVQIRFEGRPAKAAVSEFLRSHGISARYTPRSPGGYSTYVVENLDENQAMQLKAEIMGAGIENLREVAIDHVLGSLYHGRPFEQQASWVPDDLDKDLPAAPRPEQTNRPKQAAVAAQRSSLSEVRTKLRMNRAGFVTQAALDRMCVPDQVLATLMDDGTLDPTERGGMFGYKIMKDRLAVLETRDFEEIKLKQELLDRARNKRGSVIAIDEPNKKVELQYKDGSTGWASPLDLEKDFEKGAAVNPAALEPQEPDEGPVAAMAKQIANYCMRAGIEIEDALVEYSQYGSTGSQRLDKLFADATAQGIMDAVEEELDAEFIDSEGGMPPEFGPAPY